MTILGIEEEENKKIKRQAPIREAMDIYIEGVPEGVSRRNGMISVYVGAGGSGKSSLMLGKFKKGGAYHRKFNHIYMFVPSASFHSVQEHPFKNHDKVYHELTMEGLVELHNELLERKEKYSEELEKWKENKEGEKPEMETSAVIIDDHANELKDKGIQKALNKMLIKARHLNTSFIFTLQSYLYFPKTLRKQITFATIFKPRNSEEWESIRKEILQMNEGDGKKIYDYVYDEPYMHLDVDSVEGKFYKNHNYLNIINSNTL